MWSEPELIEKLRGLAGAAPTAGIVLGIGDDCAIVRPRGAREDWLYTTDMLIEETHFRRATHGAADVGWKALARGLSDIAAMGGEARFCLLSLALASWVDARWVKRWRKVSWRRTGGCSIQPRGSRAFMTGFTCATERRSLRRLASARS